MNFIKSFPSYIQHEQMDCGPACLKIMICTPRVRQRLSVPILVLDKGCLSATSRQMKYERYTKEEPQGIQSSGYIYMLSSEHTAPVIELCEKIKYECFTLNSIE